MKLFYSPGACSTASHIVASELGLPLELEKVDLKTKQSASGQFTKLNPKGYVPALMLDNGEMLTEGVAIMQYLADQKPEAKMLPKAGTWERYRAIEWLNFISTEVHKNFSPLFGASRMVPNAEGQAQLKAYVTDLLGKRLEICNTELQSKEWLMGSQFTACDAYLFTTLSWSKWVDFDLGKWPKLMGFVEKVQMRPAVSKALKAEQ